MSRLFFNMYCRFQNSANESVSWLSANHCGVTQLSISLLKIQADKNMQLFFVYHTTFHCFLLFFIYQCLKPTSHSLHPFILASLIEGAGTSPRKTDHN